MSPGRITPPLQTGSPGPTTYHPSILSCPWSFLRHPQAPSPQPTGHALCPLSPATLRSHTQGQYQGASATSLPAPRLPWTLWKRPRCLGSPSPPAPRASAPFPDPLKYTLVPHSLSPKCRTPDPRACRTASGMPVLRRVSAGSPCQDCRPNPSDSPNSCLPSSAPPALAGQSPGTPPTVIPSLAQADSESPQPHCERLTSPRGPHRTSS